MTIYLDAVWALNFFLDMMLLLLTQALAKDSTRKGRILFGAFIASLLVPITLYFPDSFFSSILGRLLYSIIIIICAFRFVTVYQTLKLLALFYFTTFSIGGGLIAAHFIFQNPIGLSSSGILTFNNGFGNPISWIFVIVGFPLSWYFTKVRMDKHAIEKIRYDQLCPVSIELKQKTYSTTGYIDSANQLVDPATKRPVVICDEHFLKQWFTDDDWQMLKDAHDELDLDSLPKEWERQLHIVPFQGVEGKSNFLFALRPDQLIIHYNDQKIMSNKVLIGIQFAELTKDQRYHCLLQPQIIKLSAVYSA
ncbi:sigma-E processing peptidase SpoIIGA [Virgibacillus alimentarius]|uniref:sigma-E processing peptidase SpoIIGA n=1 Tax=Virgibacillus alimentarius TaxID=698769 RepID=UPI000493B412|nr:MULTISPECIES: sigma-E processing peptidase SpoIIGA [Virgibacillus]HLR66065.1 sigma-E processing peptidase SpoIIGA [Virgibacillus sp.]